MLKEKYNDVWAGSFLLVLGAVLFAAAFTVPSGAAVTIGSDFMPKVTCGLLTILGIVIVWNGIENTKKFDENSYTKTEKNYKSLAASIAALFIYILLLVPVGFLIMTAVYIFAQAMILAPAEKRRPVLFMIIGIITAVVVYYIFRKIFVLMLPAGLLGFLG